MRAREGRGKRGDTLQDEAKLRVPLRLSQDKTTTR
jgi:hypothetical protein